MEYPKLEPHDAEQIKNLIDTLVKRIGVQRDTTIKPGFTADLQGSGEVHKHLVYKIDHSGHITITCCAAHGTSISAARPHPGVLVEFNLKSDGQIDVAWGEGHQDLDAAGDVPAWLIRELEWALDMSAGAA